MEINLSEYFGTLAACAATVVLVTGYITTHILTALNSTWKQVVSWVVSVGLGFFAQVFDLGIFAGETVVGTVLNGLGIGLVANGLFDIPLVQTVLELIKAKLKK